MTPLEAIAPAKVNLSLAITGKRADGYHELESLVVFTALGDRVAVGPADGLSFDVTGPFAASVPKNTDNLVLRAARLLDEAGGAHITLDKLLPVAAGLGGGSSDAAAALKLLSGLWKTKLPASEAIVALGADLPVCLAGRTSWVTGVGEAVSAGPSLPPAWLVLINPGVPLETGAVFAAREGGFSASRPPPAAFGKLSDLVAWLQRSGNDLETPALSLCPAVGEAKAALERQGAALARMSGSGATCFGLFAREGAAFAARAQIAKAQPGWWVTATSIAA